MVLVEFFCLEGFILDLFGEYVCVFEVFNKFFVVFIEVNSDNVLFVYSVMGNVYMLL